MDLALRPPYDAIDFKALTKKDDDFKQSWQKCSGKLDFQDPRTMQTLSKAIMKADFGLQLQVPDDRLCPPIPNRWNYVSWIHSLVDSTSPLHSGTYDPERRVTGLDIGAGASAIYTMLCLISRPNWSMCATDMDKKSFESAARNLALNNLMTRTKLFQSTELNTLIPLRALGVEHLDFIICNPPFFTDAADMSSSLKGEGKTCTPNAICTGAEVEMVCEGGDLGFVTRIVKESLVLRDKVQWYTSMLGKLSSAKAIIELLKKYGITNWAVGCIDTGSSTKRWVVGWSFVDLRPKNSVARLTAIANECLPFPTSYTIPLPSSITPSDAKDIITVQLASLDLEWTWEPATSSGVGEARQNVWSRAYRRAYEKKKKEGSMAMSNEDGNVVLAFRIRVIDLAREVELSWLRGWDRVIWESFCGLVHRHFKKSE